ncbi:histidine kinase [Haloferula sp. A504]|uniref:histidine kinase n=1 Tax=Haloferula sp. A504 TaxID=3373601 RepID=UPI0031C01609|nr:histidine kinase [Verrucomicrobiaceae bacterium E54]
MNFRPAISLRIAAFTLVLVGISPLSSLAQEAQSSHPIGRVARLINPSLVEVEDRLTWLENRVRGLAVYSPKPLKETFGWRAVQDGDQPPPSLTLDLGDVYPLEDIFLVPAQIVLGESRTLFPMRIRIEAALDKDFSDARVIYETRQKIHENQDGYPMRIVARDVDARYVRLRVLLGHHRGFQSISSLAEMVIISGGEPVSFGAKVSAHGSLDDPGYWDANYVIDGRSPLGTWEGGKWTNSRGQLLNVRAGEQAARWQIDLGQETPVERIVMFPVRLPELGGVSALPQGLRVSLSNDPEEAGVAREWRHQGGETYTPISFIAARTPARFVTIHAESAVNAGRDRFHPIAEIEVWSQGRNLAPEADIKVRLSGTDAEACESLVDGYANGLQVFPIGVWLRQLTERRAIEDELSEIVPLRNSMAAESELNATWGASVAIGLTLLIPVAFVERRRLVSRKQVDSLRKRIASDLHDDIGSNLGSISLIARSAKKDLARLQGPNELAEDLDEVEVIARESSLAMRDIVWLLERRQDTIGDFVQRMRDCAQRLLRDIDYELVCRSNRTASKMTLDAKRHLFLFYKEALHNVLKHSQATKVRIHVRDLRDSLVMEVEDNGIGLPVDESGTPAAVRKLADRAAVLEGRLEVNSKQGQGTSLHLEVKRSILTTANSTA